MASIQARMIRLVRDQDRRAAAEGYLALVTELAEAEQEAEAGFVAAEADWDVMDTYWRKMYCAGQVKAYHIALLLTNFVTHCEGCPLTADQMRAQRDYFVQRTRAASKEILDIVPMALEPLIKRKDAAPRALFDAMKLIWPLTAIYIIPSTLPEQKNTAEMLLLYIGREMGIKQALHTYPGGTFSSIPPEALNPRGLEEDEQVAWVGRLPSGRL
jgi:hypothetical protein